VSKPRESYAETRVRDRRPRQRVIPPYAAALARSLPPLTHKEDRPCCNTYRDDDGRLPIGFCPGIDSERCLGAVERDARIKLRGRR